MFIPSDRLITTEGLRTVFTFKDPPGQRTSMLGLRDWCWCQHLQKLWLADWLISNSFFTSASDIGAGMVIGRACLARGHLQTSLSRMNSQFGRWVRRLQSEKECLEVMQFETTRWTPYGLSWSCPPKPRSITMIPSFRDAPL